MPRVISTALQAEFDKQITRVGYLVQVNVSPVLRWCNVGSVSWSGFTWNAYDFDLRGVGGSTERVAQPTLKVQNLDSAAAQVFMTADMSTLTLDVYQIAPSATAAGDAVRVGKYFVGYCEIGTDALDVRLVPEVLLDAFSPRRKIDSGAGFKYALPEGTQIAWGNEVYFVGLDLGSGGVRPPGGRLFLNPGTIFR